MGVDHCRLDVAVAQGFLKGSDVMSALNLGPHKEMKPSKQPLIRKL